jgi:murein DD-endopeptidase MepM/ murein hydrolase activator NlpD
MLLSASFSEKHPPFPVMGPGLQGADFAQVDLSTSGPGCQEDRILTLQGLQQYIEETLQQQQAQALYGGYLEQRCFYQRSHHFKNESTNRTIHLGVDVWMPAGTAIYAPYPARVHSLAYNDQPLDYGATIILEHEIGDFHFHTLYGHLSRASLSSLSPGDSLSPGTVFTHLGDPNDNGGWTPHLHLQFILDMEGKKGDYPGVAAPSDLEHYQRNCPNPTFLLGSGWPEN